jgi:SAM-dependent methyltransferase
MIKRLYRRVKNKLLRSLPKDHKKFFSEIYAKGTWGENSQQKFYSGTGSDEPYSVPYSNVITKFIKDNNIQSVVDLGCGDFRIGRKITGLNAIQYTGVDVVADLIDFNNKQFGSDGIKFQLLNIVRDKLPDGQLCLIRQVLQHLSNADIQKVIKKLGKFDYVIITEHQPVGDNIIPNIDQLINAGIRLGVNSGVYLDKSPFNKRVEELLTVYPKAEKNSKIVTFRVFL